MKTIKGGEQDEHCKSLRRAKAKVVGDEPVDSSSRRISSSSSSSSSSSADEQTALEGVSQEPELQYAQPRGAPAQLDEGVFKADVPTTILGHDPHADDTEATPPRRPSTVPEEEGDGGVTGASRPSARGASLPPGAYHIDGINSNSNESSNVSSRDDREPSIGEYEHSHSDYDPSEIPTAMVETVSDQSEGFFEHSLDGPLHEVTACVVDDDVVEAAAAAAQQVVLLEQEREALDLDRKRLRTHRRQCGWGFGLLAVGLVLSLAFGIPALTSRGRGQKSAVVSKNNAGTDPGSNMTLAWSIHSYLQGPTENGAFGRVVSFALNGTLLAVSSSPTPSYGDKDPAGSVRVYQISAPGQPWQQVGQTINGSGTDYLWGKLSSDGRRLVVGARRSQNLKGQINAGRVEVYRFNDTRRGWDALGEPLFGRSNNYNCGADVAYLEDVVAFSCIRTKMSHARVQVHKFEGGRWIQLGSEIQGIKNEEEFGKSIALSRGEEGLVLAVGSPRYQHVVDEPPYGSVQVFAYNDTSSEWTRKGQTIVGSDANNGYGWSIAMSDDGTIIAGGALNNNDVEQHGGHVRCFTMLKGKDKWSQLGTTIDGEEPASRMAFVSLTGDGKRLAVSGRTGLAKVLDLADGEEKWNQVGETIKSEHDYVGFFWTPELSKDGSRLAIGAPHVAEGRGEVVIYDLPSSEGVYSN